jgi:hypothetical protein
MQVCCRTVLEGRGKETRSASSQTRPGNGRAVREDSSGRKAEFGRMLAAHGPEPGEARQRGDGARSGQPVTIRLDAQSLVKRSRLQSHRCLTSNAAGSDLEGCIFLWRQRGGCDANQRPLSSDGVRVCTRNTS